MNKEKNNNTFSMLKTLIKSNIRQYGMIIALVLITIIFAIATNGLILRPLNVTNILLQNAHIIVLAVGMLLVTITGNTDLSVGSVAAFISAMSGMFLINMGWSTLATIIAVLLIAILVGVWNGYWIAYRKIPAFIVTLGGMLIFRGLTLAFLKGETIGPLTDAFKSISTGFIPDIFNGNGIHILTVLIGIVFSIFYAISIYVKRKKRIAYGFQVLPIWLMIVQIVLFVLAINMFTITIARHKGFPTVSLILVLVIAVYSFITQKTVLGRHIYAMGGNTEAAKLSGINTKRTLFLVFTNMGLLAGLSGILYAARLGASTPKAGESFELDAIAAAFIGGASASGGVGTVIGAVIGALVMGIINNGMSLLSVPIYWQQVVKGLVLLLAVWFDISTKNRSK